MFARSSIRLTGVEEGCCGPYNAGVKKVGPDSASDPHYKYLMEVTAAAVTGSIMNATANRKDRKRGAFVPACLDHPLAWFGKDAPALPFFRRTGAGGAGVNGTCNQNEAVSSWFFDSGKDFEGAAVKACPLVLLDSSRTARELEQWSCNKGKVNLKQQA